MWQKAARGLGNKMCKEVAKISFTKPWVGELTAGITESILKKKACFSATTLNIQHN